MFEVGLGRLVSFDSGPFIGREALMRRLDDGVQNRLVTLVLDGPSANPIGDEPVWLGDRIVGKTTSAAFGYRVGKPVALALLSTEAAIESGTEASISITGHGHAAMVVTAAAFDPSGDRMRGRISR